MHIKSIAIFLVVLFYSCNHEQKTNPRNGFPVIRFPVILDTAGKAHTEIIGKSLRIGDYKPLYIGKLKDTIAIIYPRNYLEKYYVYDNVKKNYPYPDSFGIKIMINTSTFISDDSYSFLDHSITYGKQTYKAFPVLIYNTRSDTINIGYGDHLPLITEALDPEGNWRAIEDHFMYDCGVGLNSIVLPPDEILLTATPIYKGVFKTKLRLRYNKVLSEEFDGAINLKQFEKYYEH